MKAIQEKRISLRSLWRMGLVILSVFALVFAACGSSDSGDPSSPIPTPPPSNGQSVNGGSNINPTRTVVEIEILTQPFASYQGQAPNLQGMTARVRYNDGTTEPVSDTSKFYATATDVSGQPSPIVERGVTRQEIFIYHADSRGAFARREVEVVPIEYVNGNYSVSLTGVATKQDYFEDDLPDFSGLLLQADYVRGGVRETRVLPMTVAREDNWYNSNMYYRNFILMPDGITPRSLIDPVSYTVTYRVASNGVPLPRQEQARGDINNQNPNPFPDNSLNPIFVTFRFSRWFPVDRLTYEGPAVGGPYPADNPPPSPLVLMDTLRGADIRLTVSYIGDPWQTRKEINMDEYYYAVDRNKALIPSVTQNDFLGANRELAVNTRLLYFDSRLQVKDQLINTAELPNSATVGLRVYVFEDYEIDFAPRNVNRFFPEVFASKWGVPNTVGNITNGRVQFPNDTPAVGAARIGSGDGGTLEHYIKSFKDHLVVNYIYMDPNDSTAAPLRVRVPFNRNDNLLTANNRVIFFDNNHSLTEFSGVYNFYGYPLNRSPVNRMNQPDVADRSGQPEDYANLSEISSVNGFITETYWQDYYADRRLLEDGQISEREVNVRVYHPQDVARYVNVIPGNTTPYNVNTPGSLPRFETVESSFWLLP